MAGRQAELQVRQQEVQKKTFTRWVNIHLADRQIQLTDLQYDLCSGVNLAHLLEIISAKTIEKWSKNPKAKIHRVENLGKCFAFIKGEGLTVVNMGPEDIEVGNIKLILGLIWTLILRYQIVKGGGNKDGVKNELMKWVNSVIEPYGQTTKDFSTSYQNPKVLSALVKALQDMSGNEAKSLDLTKVDPSKPTPHIDEAMRLAEAEFKIPRVVDAVDMAENPDELSIMTYISYFREAWMARQKDLLVDPDKSYAIGNGLKGIGANINAPPNATPLSFTVHALDSKGKACGPGVECTAKLTHKDTGNNIPIAIKSPGNGMFVCEYDRRIPLGEYCLEIELNGKRLKGYPSTFTVKPLALPDKSYAKGPGLEDGIESAEPRDFLVYAIGQRGELVKGAPVEVSVKGPKGEPIEVTCTPVLIGPGTDAVSYTPTAGPGKYTVEVKIDGVPIQNMPVVVTLKPGASGKRVRMCKFKFTCMARGEDGEKMTDGGDKFEVFITEQGNQATVPVSTQDHGNGSYSAEYQLQAGKIYTVRCLINNQDMAESPFTHDLRGRNFAG